VRSLSPIPAVLLAFAATLATAQEPSLEARVAELRSRVVVVNFWAVWCEPCKREMPMLARLSSEYAPREVTFIGASIDDPEEVDKARAFARKTRVEYPLVFGATTDQMIAFRLGDAVPVTILLDRAGTPRFRMVGEIQEAQLRERLDWLLGSQSGDAPQELTLPDGMSVDHFKDDHEAGESEEHKHEEEQAAKEGGSAVPG
jgi:thiol-disulfide isomerase/thioredoxin